MGLPFVLLGAIAGGYYVGLWVDGKFGFRYGNVIGLILGFGIGLYEVVRQLQYLEKRNRD